MPNGTACFYRDSDHSYWRDYNDEADRGIGRILGCSSLGKRGDDTNVDGLLDWAVRQGDWRAEQNRRGLIGATAHMTLELLAGGTIPDLDLLGGHELGLVKWWTANEPTPLAQEFVVYSAARGYAGRADLLALLQVQRALLDLKSGSLRRAAAVQLNLYALAMADAGFEPVERLGIIKTWDDGSCALIDVPIRPDWALAALAMERASKEIQREVITPGLKQRAAA